MSYIYVHREDLRKWQIATLEIQQEFQNLLNKCGIQNWCGGGTLIGAVREGKFLYWDNDLDMFVTTKDVRRILLLFREVKFLDKYDLYFYRRGFWQKADDLMSVLTSKKFDPAHFEYELVGFKQGMFKIFSREGVSVKFYESKKSETEEYVKIKHYAKVHLTRWRLANRNDSIEDGQSYSVLPNVCVIPMLELKYIQYIVSIINYELGSLFNYAGKQLVNLFEDHINKNNIYENEQVSQKREQTNFDPNPLDSFFYKTKMALKNTTLGIYEFLKAKIKNGNGDYADRYIAYQPRYFRFIVLPFNFNYIFPTQLIKFEDTYISAPNQPEAVLRIQFGDFGKVPAEADRVGYPFFIADRMDYE